MRCSVVFGVTLRLLVINISSSSPAINTATYYQRCVTLNLGDGGCGPPATVFTTPACSIVNSIAVKKPDIGSESRFLPTQPTCDAPVRGGGVRRSIAMPFGTETLEWCGYTTLKKFDDSAYVYSF